MVINSEEPCNWTNPHKKAEKMTNLQYFLGRTLFLIIQNRGFTPTWQAWQMHITSGRCHDCNDCHAFCEILLQSPLLVNQSSVG